MENEQIAVTDRGVAMLVADLAKVREQLKKAQEQVKNLKDRLRIALRVGA
jgi:hypothetical protein